MDKVALLGKNERRELFNETAIHKKVTPAIAEKDFWVTWILYKIFNDPYLSSVLMFKGGTSLSKVFNIIERFSEDIDLILDWNTITEDDPLLKRSNTKQGDFNERLNETAHEFLINNLLPKFKTLLQPTCTCEPRQNTQLIINVNYPAIFSDEYLHPQILLEIGPLGAWLPFNQYSITSFAAESFPQLFDHGTGTVNVIVAERTFWEKATILHHEVNRPEESKLPARYSRHYYDLAMLALSDIKSNALKQLNLLENVVEFKQKFYPRGWAKYHEILEGNLKLMPDGYRMDELNEDYKKMRAMVFGNYPKFEEILAILSKLEQEINNSISQTRALNFN